MTVTGIPIFFCERTGEKLFYRGCRCASCGHRMQVHSTAEEYASEDFSSLPMRDCDQCGAACTTGHIGYKEAFRRHDTGEIIYDLPPGAVYEHRGYSDDGQPHNWKEPERTDGRTYYVNRPNEQDGRVLACVCPDGHHWIIDARASNCMMPEDNAHWCWVRHGRPEDGTLHVDKAGVTCAAGAGSIQTSSWHGFLHNGALVQC